MDCPCKGCVPPKRSTGNEAPCHGYCVGYLTWKKEREDIKELAKKDPFINRR
jgi:hypothetical protein